MAFANMRCSRTCHNILDIVHTNYTAGLDCLRSRLAFASNHTKSILLTCTKSWYRGLEGAAHSGVTIRKIFN